MAKKNYTRKEVRDLNEYLKAFWYCEKKANLIGVSVNTLLYALLSGEAKRQLQEYYESDQYRESV